MAKTADDLREKVLALPTRDRAWIATELLASLDSETVERRLPARSSVPSQRGVTVTTEFEPAEWLILKLDRGLVDIGPTLQ